MQPITCSVDEAAAAIGIGRVTLYKYIKEGRVQSVRLGGRRLVKIDSIRSLVEAA